MAHIETGTGRDHLRADCAACAALCCVATTFSRSADFAIDRPAGTPCVHLAGDLRCSIHDELAPRGFPGCAAFDCFGAGQRVTGHTFAGTDWRQDPGGAAAMFDVFHRVRALHELLWYVEEAVGLVGDGDLQADLVAARERVERLALSDAEVLGGADADDERARVVPLLRAASEHARRGVGTGRRRPRDLVGADLRGEDLSGADLRGALLLGADLRGARLRRTDVTGADLRAADVRGTDLSEVLFLTAVQVGGARGDAGTTLPGTLVRPGQWR
ncbi:pentapeptide repeat-containing protein [Nocardioides sp. SYSU DS0663]|uniref:pentapeptide repeat-containing protein n=1 Tax=Nocardioides sp. SYSU DS0663 TaxID=3416445 RepID=UPI003F4C9D73